MSATFGHRKSLPSPSSAARFDPRSDIRAVRRNHDGVLMATALLVAVAVSSVWLPSLSWASAAAGVGALEQVAGGKSGRLAGPDVGAACAGQPWGEENLGCIAAIARASGRPLPQGLRLAQPVALR